VSADWGGEQRISEDSDANIPSREGEEREEEGKTKRALLGMILNEDVTQRRSME